MLFPLISKRRCFALTCWFTALLLQAQPAVLSLDSCRAMALRNNKQLAQTRLALEKAGWEHEAARTNYLPKVSLTAGYMRTGKQVSLLSDEQKRKLNNLGTTAAGGMGQAMQQLAAANPDLLPLLQGLGGYLPALEQGGNALGQGLTDALHTDTRNMTAGLILLTQPLYMGGKIRAYDRITQLQRQVAADGLRTEQHEVMLAVDKAYWQTVSLANKRRLAMKYRDMLARLDSDVVKMVTEGVATRSNELSVSVKLNEAEMTLTKVEDGLTLSRMLLCQLCGLPLDSRPALADEQSTDLAVSTVNLQPDVAGALQNRPELCQLSTAQSIYEEKVKIERSAFLPQLALTGGYMLSNPNVFNSFERKFNGTWGVGVVLKVPVWNWGEGKYKVRAAKAEASMAGLKRDEVREQVELQVTQEAFRVNEAARKLQLSLKNLDKAEENLRTARLGFAEGVITTSDLLAAQTAWLQAHSDKIDAQIDIKLSRAAYDKAIGQSGHD